MEQEEFTINEIGEVFGFEKELTFMCVKSSGYIFTTGSLYKIIQYRGLNSNHGKTSYYDSGSIARFILVNDEEETFEPLEMNLWDSMELIEGLDRHTAKSVVYELVLRGSFIEVAKKYKLSLAQLSEIVVKFNTYTGYTED